MVLVDGVDVKKQYLSICQDIVALLQMSIHHYILDRNSEISKEVTQRQEQLRAKAETTEKLVELEALITKILNVESKRIKGEFEDLKKWLSLLYGTIERISEDDLKQLYLTANLVYSVLDVVRYEQERLEKEREDIELKLKKKKVQLFGREGKYIFFFLIYYSTRALSTIPALFLYC